MAVTGALLDGYVPRVLAHSYAAGGDLLVRMNDVGLRPRQTNVRYMYGGRQGREASQYSASSSSSSRRKMKRNKKGDRQAASTLPFWDGYKSTLFR